MSRAIILVGFGAGSEETVPGVVSEKVVERRYRGDLIRSYASQSYPGSVNVKMVAGHRVSLIHDTHILDRLDQIRYAVVSGVPWQVTSVLVEHPRVVLTLGERYILEDSD